LRSISTFHAAGSRWLEISRRELRRIVVDAVGILRGVYLGTVGVAQRAVGSLLSADVITELLGLIEQSRSGRAVR